MRLFKICVLVFSVFLFSTNVVLAQPSPVEASLLKDNKLNYSDLNKALSDMEKNLRSGKMASPEISDYVTSLGTMQKIINEEKKKIQDSLDSIDRQLKAFGEGSETEKKSALITKKENEILKEQTALRASNAEADLALVKIDDLNSLIFNIRNQNLFGKILKRQPILLYPANFLHYQSAFFSYVSDVAKSPYTWYESLTDKHKQEIKTRVKSGSLFMLGFLAAGILFSWLIKRYFGYQGNAVRQDYLHKIIVAIAVFTGNGIIPAALAGGFLIWLNHVQYLSDSFLGIILHLTTLYILYMFLSVATVKAAILPNRPQWRLIPFESERANRISSALIWGILFVGVASLIKHIAVKAEYNLDAIYFISMLSTAAKAISIALIVPALFCNPEEPKPVAKDDEDAPMSTSSKIIFSSYVFTLGVFSLSLFGYANLSEFLFDRFIISVLFLGALYIINEVLEVIIHRILNLRFWRSKFKISRRFLVKLDAWLDLVVNILLIIVGAFTLLGIWGVSTDLLLNYLNKLFTGFNVGGLKVSLSSILLGVLVFFISMYVFNFLKSKIQNGKSKAFDIDPSLRSSVASGIGFLGILLSVVFAIAAMGGSMTNLAIIAGALSFGVGLGMQNVVSNFVSGIILLFERPIKIGDVVNINGKEGSVKQINIRSTEIEAYDMSSIIIPNSDILSSSVINMTHHSKINRVEIKIGVGYDSDVRKVMEILMDIAKKNRTVLPKPAPFITFDDFGDNSLNFTLYIYMSDRSARTDTNKQVRLAIIDRFREEGIDIPFPQRVLHIQKEDQEPQNEDEPKVKK